jgi:hypothetical protein
LSQIVAFSAQDCSPVAPVSFNTNHKHLDIILICGKRNNMAGAKILSCLLSGPLYIFSLVVNTIDNDYILDSTGDVELALPHQSEVTGPEEPLLWKPVNIDPEYCVGVPLVIPITERNARAGNANLADYAVLARIHRLRVHNDSLMTG